MTTNQSKISILSRVLMIIAGVSLVISIFLPIWRIDLDAPQYPEGLMLQIYSYKLGGNVDIINGLNHYIGMKTLHAEEFVEFAVLPYIIAAFALFSILTAIFLHKKLLYLVFFAFASFGVLAMYDFWHWEYEYGHNLDPNAAIIVPGMAYQPPLIGFKQLLNFGAYSIPDLGGWMFILSGLLMLFAVLFEMGYIHKIFHLKSFAIIVLLALESCSNHEPKPIKLNIDNCDFCMMTIADIRFGAELITDKGRVYKFDDLKCMLKYMNENNNQKVSKYYISKYTGNNELINAESAFYIFSEQIKSPMRGNYAAFSNAEDANSFSKEFRAEKVDWLTVNNK